jgi:DNA-binding response OmpR family regulator
MSVKRSGQICFDGYAVDRELGSFHWQGEPIAIRRKTFDLLVYLIDHRDALASKEALGARKSIACAALAVSTTLSSAQILRPRPRLQLIRIV